MSSEQAVKDRKLTPRARIHHLSVRGADPVYMLTGPIPATRHALEKTGLSIEDIDVVEINEAFAPRRDGVAQRDQGRPGEGRPERRRDRTRASARCHRGQAVRDHAQRLERTGGRYGLQTMCEGGGTANVTIIERL